MEAAYARGIDFPLTHNYARRILVGAMENRPSIDARDIIGRWPSRKTLAQDTGRSPVTVHSWWQRNSIPADVDVVMVEAARERGFALTYEELARTRALGEAAA